MPKRIAFSSQTVIAAGNAVPSGGRVFISVKDYDKGKVAGIAQDLAALGFEILSTAGTAKTLTSGGVRVTPLPRLDEGRPNIMDYIKNRDVDLLINTPSGPKPRRDEVRIRSTAVARNIPLVTTMSGAKAMVNAIRALRHRSFEVRALQDIYASGGRVPDAAEA
jgi:carbamoyl-phosphate synthase large subunit